MLTHLHISNIVLIDKLNLEFGAGLNILTGETGAGKSILLDALALALGARSDVGLVRHGCDTASVIAEFDNIDAGTRKSLDENGIDFDGTLILRRTLSVDGKSRAWINDVPVSVKMLKQIGDGLVEIHGQFANHTLLNPATHRLALDSFGVINNPKYNQLLDTVRVKYNEYHSAEKRMHELQQMLDTSAAEREFLEHNVNELTALNVHVGEEATLSAKRTEMMNAEKDAAILSDAVAALNPRGEYVCDNIYAAANILLRIKTDPNPYAQQIDDLYSAAEILSDVSEKLAPADIDTETLDATEERLFAIRAAARKHRVSPDELPEKLAQMSAQLNTIENSDAQLQKTQSELNAARTAFDTAARELSAARATVAAQLRTKILAELPDLKLGTADFMVECTQTAPSVNGIDDITFMIKTNPGMPFAPLNRAASGGELSRLMLALRVVLIPNDVRTFIFDEIDTGISGATASAVGQRLNRLAQKSQTLVVTHSAQVAGYANKHFKISKHSENDTTTTTVTEILGDERINEIARIISGAQITPESLATAKTLIQN